MPSLRVLILLLAVGMLTGCGNSLDGRESVSGTITFKKQPLVNGTISFYPVSAETGTQAGAPIANGAYSITAKQGLKPGMYRIAISSPDGKTPEPGSDAAPGPSGNFSSVDRIPPAWNSESKKEVEIKAGQANQFNFDIP